MDIILTERLQDLPGRVGAGVGELVHEVHSGLTLGVPQVLAAAQLRDVT